MSAHRWQPGQSGNPHGRPPKALQVTRELRQLLEQPESVDDEGRPLSKAAVIAQRLTDLCMHPDPDVSMRAISIVMDRVEGGPKAYDVTEEGDGRSTEQRIDALRARLAGLSSGAG